MTKTAAQHLIDISRELDVKSREADQLYRAQARANAAYKQGRAKAVLRHKAGGERMSQAEAETRADADDTVADLYEQRLVAEAAAEALRDLLRALRERVSAGRSFLSTERTADVVHATSSYNP